MMNIATDSKARAKISTERRGVNAPNSPALNISVAYVKGLRRLAVFIA
jgi:hypothetical protein